MKKIFLIATILSLSFSYSVLAEKSNSGAKAIFYSGEGPTISTMQKAEDKSLLKPSVKEEEQLASKKNIRNVNYMGIAYWIDLVQTNGEQIRTTTSRVFKSGERIKLNIKSNRNGYLYVINIGSTGSSRVLFPPSSQPDNFVEAHKTYIIPYNNQMKFDENPGDETLLVLLSPKELKELVPSIPNVEAKESDRYLSYANSKGAKDIILENDISLLNAKTAQYAVAPMPSLENGRAISLFIKLKHK